MRNGGVVHNHEQFHTLASHSSRPFVTYHVLILYLKNYKRHLISREVSRGSCLSPRNGYVLRCRIFDAASCKKCLSTSHPLDFFVLIRETVLSSRLRKTNINGRAQVPAVPAQPYREDSQACQPQLNHYTPCSTMDHGAHDMGPRCSMHMLWYVTSQLPYTSPKISPLSESISPTLAGTLNSLIPASYSHNGTSAPISSSSSPFSPSSDWACCMSTSVCSRGTLTGALR